MSLKGYRWEYLFKKIVPPPGLVRKYGRLLAQLLVNRGFETPPREEKILLPLSVIPNFEKAFERILKAVKTGEVIFIFGDYDADGLTSTAIFYKLLKRLGAKKVYPVVPERGEGYGLLPQWVDVFYKVVNGGGGLIIALDNGTKEVETVTYAKRLGFDVVIFDHHTPGDRLPNCILVNPKVSNSPQYLKDLSTAGLVYLFAKYLEKLGYPIDAEVYLDLSALGTVADVATLSPLNAKIVAKGLQNIKRGIFSSKGLKILFGKLKLIDPNGRDIAFKVAPRINAFGRMGKARRGLKFLATEREDFALNLYKEMELLNTKRKKLSQSATEEVLKFYEKHPSRGLVYVSKKLPKGVLGIVAGRVASSLGIPTVVMAADKDEVVGSARSPEGIDIVKVLEKLDHLMVRWGGHSQAAGLTLKPSNLRRFEEEFLQEVSRYEPEPPPLEIDFPLNPKRLRESSRLREVLRTLEPYGEGNRHPTFVFEDVLLSFERTPYGYRLTFKENGEMYLNCDGNCTIPNRYRGARVRVAYIVENPAKPLLSVEDLKII